MAGPADLPRGNIAGNFLVGIPLTPASVAANTTVEQTFTVAGVVAGDFIDVNKPTVQAGLGIINVRVIGTNSVGIGFANTTASPIVPTAGEVYQFTINRPTFSPVPTGIE